MSIDVNNPVVKLCMEGARLEFEGRKEDARRLYWQAWESAQDDYEACIAAHYVAHVQEKADEILRWNQEALTRAERVGDDRVNVFYPSLYLNMGHAYELLGSQDEAKKYYDLAARLGAQHQPE